VVEGKICQKSADIQQVPMGTDLIYGIVKDGVVQSFLKSYLDTFVNL
jgi:hypothetical protein